MIRCYVEGVEVDKIKPRLAFLDKDDWFKDFIEWVHGKYPTIELWAVWDRPVDPTIPLEDKEEAILEEVWVGILPEKRRKEVGDDRVSKFFRNLN